MRSTFVLVASLLIGATLSATSAASECIPNPTILPGLSGPPDWVGTPAGTDWRPELDDPRWATAELRRFATYTDPMALGTAEQARYRILIDNNSLYVSIQMLVDPSTTAADAQDAVYFAFDKANFGTSTWAFTVYPDRTAPDHTAADAPAGTVPQETPPARLPYAETAGSSFDWFESPLGTITDWDVAANKHPGAKPPFVTDVATWRQAFAGEWAITFRIDLASLGFPASPPAGTTPIKMFIGARRQHTGGGLVSFGSSTLPADVDSVGYTAVDGAISIVPKDKSGWLQFSPPGYGACTAALSIDSGNIGTLRSGNLYTTIEACSNAAGCSTSPSCYSTPGCVPCCPGGGHANTFQARVQGLTSSTGIAHEVRAKFRIAEWGSTYANWQYAPWKVVPGIPDTVFTDDLSTLTDPPWQWSYASPEGRISFTCTPGASSYCPLLTNASGYTHQCMMVELSTAPSTNHHFSTTAAYTNMDFIGLSESVVPATISIKGLQQAVGLAGDRDVYLYVETRNMPPHGNEPLWLHQTAMAAAREYSQSPPALPPQGKQDPPPDPGQGDKAGAAGKPQQPKPEAQKPAAPPKKGPDGKPIVEKAPAPMKLVAPRRERLAASEPRTVLDTPVLSSQQALVSVWPTYRVFPYFDTGRTTKVKGVELKVLEPLVPFGFYLDHDGPFYGFSHLLEGLDGLVVTELAPNYYKIRVPSEGAVRVQTKITAQEKPKDACPSKAACEQCYGTGHGHHCHCRLVGAPSRGSAEMVLALMLGLGALARRRTRRSS